MIIYEYARIWCTRIILYGVVLGYYHNMSREPSSIHNRNLSKTNGCHTMTTDFVNFIVSVFFPDRLRWWVHLYNVIITIILLYAYVYHDGRPLHVVFFLQPVDANRQWIYMTCVLKEKNTLQYYFAVDKTNAKQFIFL